MKSKENYLSLIRNNPVQIGHAVGFNDLTELHNEWLILFMFSTDDASLQSHRGSFKTTCLSLAIALLLVIHPSINIIVLRKTDTDVTEIINQVSKILKTDAFSIIVQALYGVELKFIEDNSCCITTNLFTAAKGASQLLGLGTKTSITGKHADLVITDDIVNLEDRRSRAERERTKAVYMELQNIKNRGGRILNTGTPWHKDDAASLMPNIIKYDCYQTGLIERNELEKIRSKMTNSLFAANYELKHIASDDVIFTEPKFTDKIELIYNGLCHIDARYFGDDGTVFTILKKQPDGRFVGFGKRWNKHADDCLNEIEILRTKYRAGILYLENNADKGYLAKDCRKRGIQTREYHESMNKYVKITTYLKAIWHLIDWLTDTDPEYINEILDYNEQAEHDDSPDSAASLAREGFKPSGVRIG